MYHVSAQGVDERMINVHYYYYYYKMLNNSNAHQLFIFLNNVAYGNEPWPLNQKAR